MRPRRRRSLVLCSKMPNHTDTLHLGFWHHAAQCQITLTQQTTIIPAEASSRGRSGNAIEKDKDLGAAKDGIVEVDQKTEPAAAAFLPAAAPSDSTVWETAHTYV